MFYLIKFVNHLAASLAPAFISPHLCSATLLDINKKNGGLRPIAVGEVLCHLVSKCLAIATCPTALSLLFLLQLGVGVKGGCEAIIHASSHLMLTTSTHHPWSLLLDFSNAFNNISLEASFCEEVFQERINKISFSLNALQNLCDSQLESTLLCSCLALPKVSFVKQPKTSTYS